MAAFYLNHRYSEDLDFFTEKEDVDTEALTVLLKSFKDKLNIKEIDFQKSLNRNLFFIKTGKEIIKTEFTYFPFRKLQKGLMENNLEIDSIEDIAVNKLFTIYQKPQIRHFVDLFFIIEKRDYKVEDLIMKAKLKFDWPIDYLNLGTQFIKVKDLKDYPKMIKEIDEQRMIDFYIDRAAGFKKNIIE